MILILDQTKDCSRGWSPENRLRPSGGADIQKALVIERSAFVAVQLSDGSGYYIYKNRDGESGYTVKGELALNQLISENLK
jgi:hypothetical protein